MLHFWRLAYVCCAHYRIILIISNTYTQSYLFKIPWNEPLLTYSKFEILIIHHTQQQHVWCYWFRLSITQHVRSTNHKISMISVRTLNSSLKGLGVCSACCSVSFSYFCKCTVPTRLCLLPGTTYLWIKLNIFEFFFFFNFPSLFWSFANELI